MLKSLAISQIYVLDQGQAVDFYVGKLGLKVKDDQDLGFMRWRTVAGPGDEGRRVQRGADGAALRQRLRAARSVRQPHPVLAADRDTVTAMRTLLACGAVAGPLFVIVGFGQAFTRPGFDLTRHPLSVLSNGDLGWLQIANFLVSGLL